VERIIEQSGTPYFCFKDLDENRPAASIRIRLETIDYFLRREREARRETTGADAIESGVHQIRTG
jgi:predicted nucleotide-binding protein (sugar kinase/HSP70/actin superfamily)